MGYALIKVQTFVRKKIGPKRNGQENDKLAQCIIDCPFFMKRQD